MPDNTIKINVFLLMRGCDGEYYKNDAVGAITKGSQ
jgi:hypothetical protein